MGLPRPVATATGLEQAASLLKQANAHSLSRELRGELAEQLAAALLRASRVLTRPEERKRQQLLSRLVEDPYGQALTTALTDRVFRSRDLRHVVDQLAHLSSRYGIPQYMPLGSRAQLGAARLFGGALPGVTGKAILARLRQEARAVILPADADALATLLAQRKAERVRINVNQLGEALLGEREAEQRVQHYCELARQPAIDALSVKVSSIGSQLNLLAFEHTVATLSERLVRIYRATLERPETERPIVMLDMEGYNDVALTLAVLKQALAHSELGAVRAGLALQAYLPDCNGLLREAIELSRQRVAHGGSPLRVRIVKGANLAHERVESAKSGFVLPIFAGKEEVDANFKRVVETATEATRQGSIELGVASHNLFDLAYALVLRAQAAEPLGLGIEMLEGMANDTVRALTALGIDVLVYAPICEDDAMNSGIAYLVRRLDENTSSDNFLRSSFAMEPGDAAFERERERFRRALALLDSIDERPRREREREQPASDEPYRGEPDSDFTQASRRAWVRDALWQGQQPVSEPVRSRVGGALAGSGSLVAGADPSRPNVVPYHVQLAGEADVELALQCASRDEAGFSRSSPEQRAELLRRVAQRLRDARGELIAVLVSDGGKRVVEADVEVSEAIDFAEYYARSVRMWSREANVRAVPCGTVLVTPPWNFPLAIAAGGVFAALAAGNRVILKPALHTALTGARLAQLCWDAGIPTQALQLLLCEDQLASRLVKDERVDAVILTGGTDTARLFQHMRPGIHLLAETGGKNAYIVTAMSDRELAIRDVVHSAFGHAGQKCSACSLLILHAELYDDPHFLATLKDAAQSLFVGSAWDERSFVTPLIDAPSGPLLHAMHHLDKGESWLLAPKVDVANPRLVSPGIKLGVTPGSFMHNTELFGPVLGVMRATSLEHAIELANATGYALTAGLSSLDERDQAQFIARVRAGNLYVNRTITGAIVGRQPFGGFDKSGFGPGAKAGGPNYVAQLFRFMADGEPAAVPADFEFEEPSRSQLTHFESLLAPHIAERLRRYAAAYAAAESDHFGKMHDDWQVLGQDNLFGYRAAEGVVLRVEKDASAFDVAASCIAAALTGCVVHLSVAPEFRGFGEAMWADYARLETQEELSEREAPIHRVRLLGSRTEELNRLSAERGFHIADAAVLPSGRLELLHYLREQSISVEYHRYGNLGARAMKEK